MNERENTLIISSISGTSSVFVPFSLTSSDMFMSLLENYAKDFSGNLLFAQYFWIQIFIIFFFGFFLGYTRNTFGGSLSTDLFLHHRPISCHLVCCCATLWK